MLTPALTVVIVEDQPIIRKNTAYLISTNPGVSVLGSAGTAGEAIALIEEQTPDLLLLDIQLPDGTGFDILQHFWPPKFKVIFLTAYQEHAIRAIKYGAFDYLLKPLDPGELHQAVHRYADLYAPGAQQLDVALTQYAHPEQVGRLIVRTSQQLHVLQVTDICYLEASGVYTHFYLQDGQKIVSSKNIKVYEEALSADIFVRTHQSYMVNIKFIEHFHSNGYLILKGRHQVPVATRRREAVIAFIRNTH
ncbi:LytTR family DNA-binding domain-containing protein [Chitinophaga sp. S165]|uniref:LytR/AlgR family response regulator transcription factor n=1 Tax=Chitinophaga sp. S165 TaxID=2135462 RepID=UPI000D71545E|nr:LytTR family DNA-binding domain-containing protein [Chitinophaga sp. S165]PWV47147.1 LytTR family two component transcriptional regulator [Chitinophaga sp. S165]